MYSINISRYKVDTVQMTLLLPAKKLDRIQEEFSCGHQEDHAGDVSLNHSLVCYTCCSRSQTWPIIFTLVDYSLTG